MARTTGMAVCSMQDITEIPQWDCPGTSQLQRRKGLHRVWSQKRVMQLLASLRPHGKLKVIHLNGPVHDIKGDQRVQSRREQGGRDSKICLIGRLRLGTKERISRTEMKSYRPPNGLLRPLHGRRTQPARKPPIVCHPVEHPTSHQLCLLCQKRRGVAGLK